MGTQVLKRPSAIVLPLGGISPPNAQPVLLAVPGVVSPEVGARAVAAGGINLTAGAILERQFRDG
jgi:hypothetical protein